MRNPLLLSAFLFTAALLILSGCVAPTAPTATATPAPTATATVTPTPTPVPTATPTQPKFQSNAALDNHLQSLGMDPQLFAQIFDAMADPNYQPANNGEYAARALVWALLQASCKVHSISPLLVPPMHQPFIPYCE